MGSPQATPHPAPPPIEEAALGRFFRSGPVPILALSEPLGRVVAANEAVATLTGWLLRELVDRRLEELPFVVDPGPWGELLAGKAGGSPSTLEVRHRSGRVLVCESLVSRAGENGELLLALVDLTRRLAAEERLRAQAALSKTAQETLENLLNAIPDVIGLQDRERHVLRYNAAGYRTLQIRPEDLQGRHCYELIGRDEPCPVCATATALATGQPASVQKYVAPMGAWYDARAYPVRDERGEVCMVIEHLRDITDQKRSTQERDRLFDLSLDMLCIAGFDGRFRQVNPAWTRALGWSQEEILAQPWLDLVHPDDREETVRAGERLLAGQAVLGFENRYQCRDGSYRLVSWNSFPLMSDRTIFAVVRDLTETRRMQERIRQIEKMDAIGQLAGGVAHDFNNQLVGIQGFAELLARRLPQGEERRYAESILAAARRSADLTRSLLAFARKGKYRVEPLDVHALVCEVELLLARSIDKRIVIRRELRAASSVVAGDASQLQSAVLNLALNARDAMPEGGELVFSTDVVEIGEPEAGDDLAAGRYLCLAVGDTGVGMDEATCRRVFEPFFSTKPAGAGVGLGLSAVYGTARAHGGRVTVESRPGQGSTFQVYLPLVVQPPAAPSARAAEGRSGAPGRRILLVDDEPVVREVALEALSGAGHEVTVCAGGQEAIAEYARSWAAIDLIILDLVMPGMTGRELFAALRRVHPGVRAMVSTGFSLDGEAQRLIDEGACGFIQKPFRVEELIDAVEAALARPA